MSAMPLSKAAAALGHKDIASVGAGFDFARLEDVSGAAIGGRFLAKKGEIITAIDLNFPQ